MNDSRLPRLKRLTIVHGIGAGPFAVNYGGFAKVVSAERLDAATVRRAAKDAGRDRWAIAVGRCLDHDEETLLRQLRQLQPPGQPRVREIAFDQRERCAEFDVRLHGDGAAHVVGPREHEPTRVTVLLGALLPRWIHVPDGKRVILEAGGDPARAVERAMLHPAAVLVVKYPGAHRKPVVDELCRRRVPLTVFAYRR